MQAVASLGSVSFAGEVKSESITQAPKKKICCACPDTKKLRDECIAQNGEAACDQYIEAHKVCLRAEGFKVVLNLTLCLKDV